ncbi:16838_t:CDS:2 [Entrophospora sp. SA101]|nr:16838_t:CDS:2 [Entrophospora sp. SA101]
MKIIINVESLSSSEKSKPLDSLLKIEEADLTNLTVTVAATDATSASSTTLISTTTATTNSTSVNNSGSTMDTPFAKTIIGITVFVLMIGMLTIIILVCKRRRKALSNRGLRPLTLSPSSNDGDRRRSGSKNSNKSESVTTTVTSPKSLSQQQQQPRLSMRICAKDDDHPAAVKVEGYCYYDDDSSLSKLLRADEHYSDHENHHTLLYYIRGG